MQLDILAQDSRLSTSFAAAASPSSPNKSASSSSSAAAAFAGAAFAGAAGFDADAERPLGSWAFTASVEGKDMGVNFGGVINGAKELSAADYRA
jgi:hypothetical protein